MTPKQVIEALVFASQKPLLPKEIVAAFKGAAHESEDLEALAFARLKEPEVGAMLEELRADCERRGFRLVEQVNGWHFVTEPGCAKWVRELYPEGKPARLSGPALETLAIVAYRQPLTKADIEAVRGVAVDGVMQSLTERGLIRIAGRADVPGRPLLYETTQYFLEHFGFRSLDELPNTAELRRANLPTAQPPATPWEAPAEVPLEEAAPGAEPVEAAPEQPQEEAQEPAIEEANPDGTV